MSVPESVLISKNLCSSPNPTMHLHSGARADVLFCASAVATLPPQELVQYEYELVYGADAVASVHPLRYSRELAGLEMQYTNAKQVLEDQLNNYQLLLQRGGRRPGAFMRLRSCWGDSLTGQLQRSRLPIVPITIRKVGLCRVSSGGKHISNISLNSVLSGMDGPPIRNGVTAAECPYLVTGTDPTQLVSS